MEARIPGSEVDVSLGILKQNLGNLRTMVSSIAALQLEYGWPLEEDRGGGHKTARRHSMIFCKEERGIDSEL